MKKKEKDKKRKEAHRANVYSKEKILKKRPHKKVCVFTVPLELVELTT